MHNAPRRVALVAIPPTDVLERRSPSAVPVVAAVCGSVLVDAGDGRVVGTEPVVVAADVENLVNAMAAFSPPSTGETELAQDLQDNLHDTIAASWQAGGG